MISWVLIQNANLFAWTFEYMFWVDPEVILHKLFSYKEARPRLKKKRKLKDEKRKGFKKEVEKLINASFI